MAAPRRQALRQVALPRHQDWPPVCPGFQDHHGQALVLRRQHKGVRALEGGKLRLPKERPEETNASRKARGAYSLFELAFMAELAPANDHQAQSLLPGAFRRTAAAHASMRKWMPFFLLRRPTYSNIFRPASKFPAHGAGAFGWAEGGGGKYRSVRDLADGIAQSHFPEEPVLAVAQGVHARRAAQVRALIGPEGELLLPEGVPQTPTA